jgi:hypothetical protein
MKRIQLKHIPIHAAQSGLHACVIVGHYVMQRRFVACAGGVCLMLAGTALIECQPVFISKMVWECFCYTIHATGCVPILKPLDGLVGKFTEVEMVEES